MICDKCGRETNNPEDDCGEINCNECKSNAAEAAWERFCEAFHAGEIATLEERMREARKLK